MGEFRCPACGGTKTGVIDSRAAGAFRIRRRRSCECGNRFTTFEIPMDEYRLIDGLDGGIVARLQRDAKKVSATIDRMIDAVKGREAQ